VGFGHVERRPVDSVVRGGRCRPRKTIKNDLEINDLDRDMIFDTTFHSGIWLGCCCNWKWKKHWKTLTSCDLLFLVFWYMTLLSFYYTLLIVICDVLNIFIGIRLGGSCKYIEVLCIGWKKMFSLILFLIVVMLV